MKASRRAPGVPSIFEYADFASYLRSSLEALRPEGTKYSLRNVARRVERSPSLLAMVARGDRRPQPELAAEICRVFGLAKAEVQFAEALVEYERARTVAAKTKAAETLRALKPRHDDLIVDLDSFALIASWHNYTVLELSCTPSFREDPEWISRMLGPTVSVEMAAESLALLQRLGLLVRTESGRLMKASATVRTPKDLTSAAIRRHHKQNLMRAHHAIDRQPIDQRFVTSATIAMPASILPEIKNRVGAFRDELLAFIESQPGPRDAVYQLTIPFFRATDVVIE